MNKLMLLIGGYYLYLMITINSFENLKGLNFKGKENFLSLDLLNKFTDYVGLANNSVYKVIISPAKNLIIRLGTGTSQHYFRRAICSMSLDMP